MAYYDKLLQAAEYLRSRMPFTPKVGIVLGSGLGGLVDAMGDGWRCLIARYQIFRTAMWRAMPGTWCSAAWAQRLW